MLEKLIFKKIAIFCENFTKNVLINLKWRYSEFSVKISYKNFGVLTKSDFFLKIAAFWSIFHEKCDFYEFWMKIFWISGLNSKFKKFVDWISIRVRTCSMFNFGSVGCHLSNHKGEIRIPYSGGSSPAESFFIPAEKIDNARKFMNFHAYTWKAEIIKGYATIICSILVIWRHHVTGMTDENVTGRGHR